jgi:outer membrane protein assembly factor BamB
VFVGVGGSVLGIERATGKARWQTPLAGRGTVLVGWAHDVLVATTRGEVHRLDPETGSVRWKNGLPGFGHGLPSLWIVPAGVVASGMLLIGLKGTVVAMDPANGQLRWQSPLKGRGFTGITLVGRDLYASTAGEVWRLDVESGEIRWHDGLRGLGMGIVCVGAGNFDRMAVTLRNEELEEEARASGAS